MAAYGAQLEAGQVRAARPSSTCRQLFDNVPVQDKSAREALQTFVGGKGDVLLAYENEAITAQQKGEEVDYVIPDGTILIQNPIAVTIDGTGRRGQAFVDFTRGDEAQKIFAEKGYRSVQRGPGRQVQVPDAAEPVHDRRPRRLAGGERGVLRPRGRRDGRHQQGPGVPD